MEDDGTKRWDLFVSYASEDREAFVKPLVHILQDFGVAVWWDEFELTLGDSLTRTIDAGLVRSQFGAVVISSSFLQKRWPEYELRGLLAKELAGNKGILPIWYGVSVTDVLSYSPSLADKKAASFPIGAAGQKDLLVLAVDIIRVVRPELFTRIHRRLQHVIEGRGLPLESVDQTKIVVAPPRHERLPPDLHGRVRLIRAALLGVYPHTMKFWVDGFLHDAHPSREITVWERLAAAYLELVQYQRTTPDDRKAAFSYLLNLTLGADDVDTTNLGDLGEQADLLRALMASDQPIVEFVSDDAENLLQSQVDEDIPGLDLEDLDGDVPETLINRLADIADPGVP